MLSVLVDEDEKPLQNVFKKNLGENSHWKGKAKSTIEIQVNVKCNAFFDHIIPIDPAIRDLNLARIKMQ